MLGLRAVDLVAEYTGHPYDAVLGMYFAEARMYDAADRRFVAVDPVKGSVANAATLAQYTYVLDNPLKYVDPWGLLSVTYGNGDIAYSISQSGEFLLDFDYGVTRLQSAKGNIVRISRSLTKDHLFYNISYNSANVSTGVLFDSDKSVSATTRGITYGVGSMILGTPLNDKYTGAIQYPLVTYDYFAKIVCRISSGSILGPSIIFDSLDEAYEYMDMYLVGKLKDGVLVDKAVQYAAWYGPINSVADFVTGEFAGSKNSTKFDGEILGWTNYWNSKIQQNPGRYVGQTMIRAEVVKAMIAQESSMGTATSKNAQRDIMQTLVPGDYAVWYAAGLNPLELGRFHTEPGVSGRYNAIDAIRPDGSLTHWEIVGSFNASDLKDSAAFGASGIGLLQDVVYVGGGKNGQERLYDQRNVTNRMSIAVGTGYLAWKINGAANGRGSESKGIYGYGTGADYVGVINMYLRQLRVSELNA
jgi:RHS repeat-associated protein